MLRSERVVASDFGDLEELHCRARTASLESASSVKTLIHCIVFVFLAAAQLMPAAGMQPPAGTPFEIGAGEHVSVRENAGATATPLADAARKDGAAAVTAVTPATAGAGLIIDATFDSSITNSPDAAAIESAINAAISQLQSLFSDPIRVSILFRYSTTAPNGSALGANFVAESNYVVYGPPWQTYIDALRADAKTNNDSTANASLPVSALTANIKMTGANGRALGFSTQPAMSATGTVGTGFPYDGIVTLNAASPLQFTRPASANNFDAQRFTEHEIDEILGLGSHIGSSTTDYRPQDLFSWSASGVRSQATTGSRYFSIDGGKTFIIGFNQKAGYDYGDWLSSACPQANPYVQNAIGCPGQSSDATGTSPEGVNLDVVGYDLASGVPQVQITVQPSVPNAGFFVDGAAYRDAQTFTWPSGSTHSLSSSTQYYASGVQYAFTGWSDNGSASHNIVATQSTTITAFFTTQYYLTSNSSGSGSVSPLSGWYNSGTQVTLQAAAAAGYQFRDWSGSGAGSYSGGANPAVITLNGPITETANFVPNTTPSPTAAPSPTPSPSPSASPTATPQPPGRLLNLATRMAVGEKDDVLIAGFIVTGDDASRVMLRAIGPSLPFTGTLSDPTLELYLSDGTIIANDNWRVDSQTGGSQEGAIEATGLAPSMDAESALIATLPAGAYTAIVRGKGAATGIGLIEVYDLDRNATTSLANLSSRGFVGLNDNVMIGGLILNAAAGESGKVLVRAIGPSLPVATALRDPQLQVVDANGDPVSANDDWQNDARAGEVAADQLAPNDPRESALIADLHPGAYTVIVRSQDGAPGVGLVEIYNLP